MKAVELLPYSQMLHGTPGGMLGNLQQAHNRNQQHPGLMQVIINFESVSYQILSAQVLFSYFGTFVHGETGHKD